MEIFGGANQQKKEKSFYFFLSQILATKSRRFTRVERLIFFVYLNYKQSDLQNLNAAPSCLLPMFCPIIVVVLVLPRYLEDDEQGVVVPTASRAI